MSKTVKILLNIGKDDVQRFHLKEAYKDGDLVSLEDNVAAEFIRRGWGLEYTDEVKKADEDAEKESAKHLIARAAPLAAVELAKEDAKAKLKGDKSAKAEVKDGTGGTTTAHPTSNQGEPSKEAKEKDAHVSNADFGTKPVSSRDVK